MFWSRLNYFSHIAYNVAYESSLLKATWNEVLPSLVTHIPSGVISMKIETYAQIESTWLIIKSSIQCSSLSWSSSF